jgi:hypothetical protein
MECGLMVESKKPRKGLKELLSEYGGVAMAVYFGIFFSSIAVFYMAIQAGVDLESYSWFSGTLGKAGKLGIAYAATKILQPFRIGLTVLLTPFVAKVMNKKNPDKNDLEGTST